MLEPPLTPAAPPLLELLHHGYAERRVAVAIFAAVFGTALLVAALIAPRYRATATLAILPSPEFTVRSAAGSHDANASTLALDQIMKTETEILGSDDLHAATLRAVGPQAVYPEVFAPAPRGLIRRVLHSVAAIVMAPWRVTPNDLVAARDETGLRLFRSDLDVRPAKDANVISLTFDNDDGQVAAKVVNAMLDLYATRRTRLYDDPQLEIVRKEAAASATAVAAADARLADFKRDHAISDYESEHDLLLRRRSQTDQAVADAAAASSEYQARLAALGHALHGEPATIGIFQEADADTRLLAVNAGLQDLRAKLAAALDKYKEASRVVTTLRAEIASHEAEAARLNHDPASSVIRQGRNPSIDPLRLDRARATAELAASEARLQSEQRDAQLITAALARLDGDEASLGVLQRQKATAEQDFRDASRILAERHLSEAEESRRLANVRVVQRALVPQAPRPLPLLIGCVGFLLGGVAAGVWIVGRFMFRPVFMTGEGLEAASGLQVLAVFARDKTQDAEAMLV